MVRARQMTFDELQGREKRAERRETRRTLGRWAAVAGNNQVVLTNVLRGAKMVSLGRAPTDGKRTAYGFDGLLTLSLAGSTARDAVGAIVCWHARPGQIDSDWFANSTFGLPLGESQPNDKARFGKYMPIALLGDEDSVRGSVVLPWRALFPKDLLLKPGESYNIGFGLFGTQAFSVTWVAGGRYRYIDGTT